MLLVLKLPGVFIMDGFRSAVIEFFVPYHAPFVLLRQEGSGCELSVAKNITSCPSPTTMANLPEIK